jgi:hypothetical protein
MSSTTTTFEVWLRTRGPNGALADSDTTPSKLTRRGAFDSLDEAKRAAAESRMSPLVVVGPDDELPDYAGVFVHEIRRDATRGLRVHSRR